MANITLIIAPFTTTKTISPADATRIITALKTNYGQVDGGGGVMRDRTNQELFDLWAAGTIQALRDVVKRAEGDTSAAAARAAVADIVIT